MPFVTTNVEEHLLTAADENVPGPSRYAEDAIEISDDDSESSFDMTIAQDQEMEIDAAVFEGNKKGKKDEIHKFLAIASRMITGKESHSEISRSPIINKPYPALLTKKGRPSVPNKIVCSIDLTENDDKVSWYALTTNNNQQLTQQVNNCPSTPIPAKKVKFTQSTSSGFLMKKFLLNSATPALGLTQLSTDSNDTLTSINLLTPGRHFLCKNDQLLPCYFSPIGTNDLQMQSNIIQPRTTSSGIISSPVSPSTSLRPVPAAIPLFSEHPAPPPTTYSQPRNLDSWKKLPPAPTLDFKEIRKNKIGGVLRWTMENLTKEYANIKRYELYSYYEVKTEIPTPNTWKKVGDLKVVPFPIICPLSQFKYRGKYHFIVRAVDEHDRYGPFSTPVNVFFKN